MSSASGNGETRASGVAYGVGLVLEGSDPELLARMLSWMPPAWQPGEAPSAPSVVSVARGEDGEHTITIDERIVAVVGEDDIGAEFEHSLRLHLAYTTSGHFFMHGGAVACDGRGVVILGASFSGKTELVAALVRAGAAYYSDENAVIDADGLLHPYPKPLELRLSEGLYAQTPHDVRELGGVNGQEAVPLALVLVPEYRPGARWEPAELSPSETVQVLLQHTYRGLERPQEAMRAAHQAARDAVGLKGDRGEADETAALILARLAGAS